MVYDCLYFELDIFGAPKSFKCFGPLKILIWPCACMCNCAWLVEWIVDSRQFRQIVDSSGGTGHWLSMVQIASGQIRSFHRRCIGKAIRSRIAYTAHQVVSQWLNPAAYRDLQSPAGEQRVQSCYFGLQSRYFGLQLALASTALPAVAIVVQNLWKAQGWGSLSCLVVYVPPSSFLFIKLEDQVHYS